MEDAVSLPLRAVVEVSVFPTRGWRTVGERRNTRHRMVIRLYTGKPQISSAKMGERNQKPWTDGCPSKELHRPLPIGSKRGKLVKPSSVPQYLFKSVSVLFFVMCAREQWDRCLVCFGLSFASVIC